MPLHLLGLHNSEDRMDQRLLPSQTNCIQDNPSFLNTGSNPWRFYMVLYKAKNQEGDMRGEIALLPTLPYLGYVKGFRCQQQCLYIQRVRERKET